MPSANLSSGIGAAASLDSDVSSESPKALATTAPDTQALSSPAIALAQLNRVPGLSERKRTLYGTWIQGYLDYLKRQHLRVPRPAYVKRFLEQIRTNCDCDEATYQSAAEALVFYHERLLRQTVCGDGYRLATLTDAEKRKIVSQVEGPERVLALVVCHTALDIKEALRLRVGDVEVEKRTILVTNSAGCVDRTVSFSERLQQPLREQHAHVRALHERDLAAGYGTVDVPDEVVRQFPWAPEQLMWQYLFPASERTLDIRSGTERRYPMTPNALLDAIDASDAPLTRTFRALK
jgi:integrase